MNKFDIKANQVAQVFFKRLNKGYTFSTGKGVANQIEGLTKTDILITPKRSKTPQKISKKKFIEAIAYVLYKKTATRKDLESKTNFTSSMLGLLRLALFDIARFSKTVSGLLRITIQGVRFFFSGTEKPSNHDMDVLISNGTIFILNNYYHLRERKDLDDWMRRLNELGMKVLIDPGGLTVYKKQKKGESVEPIRLHELADFINRYEYMIFGYFNLDVIGDQIATKANYKSLKELTNLTPIPIWGCDPKNWTDSDWDGLKRMVEEDHDLIGIGSTVLLGQNAGPMLQTDVKRRLFEEIFRRFPNQNFHCLGLSSNLLYEFPFYSADSKGWLYGRSKKQVYTLLEKSTSIISKWSPTMCMDFNIKMFLSLEQVLL